MFKRKRIWLIVLLCLTLVGVGAGYTMGGSFTDYSNPQKAGKGVYSMDVEYLGPGASSIVVKSKDQVVKTFYDVVAGDILTIDGSGLKDGKLKSETRFYITISGNVIEVKIHTSCSKPLAVGMVFDEHHPYLKVVALDAYGGECEPGEPPCDKPDLVISSKWEQWTCSTQYVVHFVVRNQGEGTVPAGHDVTLYVDGAEQGEHVEVPDALGPGDSWEGSFSTSITISGNSDTVKVCADNYNEVDESNESNNCKTNTVTGDGNGNGNGEPPCVPPCTTCCCSTQIAKIWQRIKQVECKMLEIQQQQAELESKIMHVRIECDQKVKRLVMQIEEVEAEGHKKRNELQQQINTVSMEMQQKTRMLEIKIDDVERRMEQSINRLERQISDVEKRTEWKIAGLEKKFTQMERELSRLSTRTDHVERELSSLESRFKNLEQENQRLWRRISELEQRINLLEARLAVMQSCKDCN